jgi:hypothetical protein
VKKFLKILGVVVLLLLIAIVLLKNILVVRAAELGVGMNTNMTMDINQAKIGVFRPVLDIEGLAVYSPDGFGHTAMLSIPEVFVQYVPSSLLPGRTLHLREVRLYLEQVAVIRNQYGQLNIASLEVQGKPVGLGARETPASTGKQTGKKQIDLIIDTLSLRVDHVMYIDYYGRKDTPEVQTLNVNLNQTFTNITNTETFISTVSRLITQRAAGAGLEDVLSRELGRLGARARKEAEQAGRQLEDVERAGEAAEDIVEEGRKTLEDATESLRDLLPLLNNK